MAWLVRAPGSRAVAALAGWGWAVATLLVGQRLPSPLFFLWMTAGAYVLLRNPDRWRTGALLATALALPAVLDENWLNILFLVALYTMLGIGLNVVVGYAGLLDLGYVAFFAVGAYFYGLLASPFYGQHWPAYVLVPAAMALAALVGALLGFPVLRMHGDYLAIVTLAFGEIIRILVLNLYRWTGGPNGVILIDHPTLLGHALDEIVEFYYVALAGAGLAAFCSERLRDSRIGRAWEAMREDEDAARACGVDTTRARLLAFATGAAFGGLGGAIFAFSQGSIFPSAFTLDISIRVLCIVIIGGMGSIPGAVLGSFLLVGLPEVLRDVSLGPLRPADYRLVVFGALLVAVVAWRPGGLLPPARRGVAGNRRAAPTAGEPARGEAGP